MLEDKIGYINLHVNQEFGYKALIFCLHYDKDWKKFHFIAPAVHSFTQLFNHSLKIY